MVSFLPCSCSCHLVCESMAHQTSLTNFPSKPITNPPIQPLSLSQAFLGDTIHKAWVPHAPSVNPRPVPTTGEWNVEELHFFKLHYLNVRSVDFETYICPFATLTPNAASIAAMTLGSTDFFDGIHVGLNDACRIFGDNIVAVESFDYSKACVDKTVQHLLDVCNPNHAVLLTVPQRQQFTIYLKTDHFNSTPDGSVIGRKLYAGHYTTTVIVVEDKKLGNDFGEYQIPGEIVGTALYNYQKVKVAQTIFAIRVIRNAVTIYRADFSVEYLEGVSAGSVACENVTIFRALGSTGDFNKGASISFPGDTRALSLTAISSILAFSAALITERNAQPYITPQATQQRLALLQDSRKVY
eukprot:Phypoly_transcript_10598.p1 GENE.Phypoly_transcript_10598~~Phypoly_transcript_10598.p1  ORF type:complete len:355 (+),score=17.85 Phypoly_transcript_10598:155-1219(+)